VLREYEAMRKGVWYNQSLTVLFLTSSTAVISAQSSLWPSLTFKRMTYVMITLKDEHRSKYTSLGWYRSSCDLLEV
jgi:hypothetical protein